MTNEMIQNLVTTENPRLALIGILNAAKVSPPLKVMGYAFLHAADDIQINNLRSMFLKVLGYIEAKDTDGLQAYLVTIGLDANILKMLMTYAANFNQDQ